ncbi:MAG: hypothetical protein VR64_23395 [Desulfatitalea sp. BRH_c12]|nr:MAG: hypothetical protein VR64_23395 [Desulfatitalea sp. BRH_c12]
MRFGRWILLLAVAMILTACASDDDKKAKFMAQAAEAMEKGDYKVAEIHLKNVIQIDPQSVPAHLKLGEAYLKSENPQGAFSAYATVVKLDATNQEALLRLATFYMLARNFEESEKHVRTLLDLNPNHIEALYLSAGLNDLQGKREAAAEAFSKIIALDARQTRAYIGMASILLHQDKRNEAEAYLQRAQALDAKDIKLWLAMVGFYASQKEYGRAEQEILNGIAANPDSADLRIAQGNLYAQQKKYDAAEKAFLKAIDIDSQSAGAYLTTARFYETTGQTDSARAMYRKTVEIKPDDAGTLISAAQFFFKIREIDEANGYIEKILSERPKFLPALMLKGEILVSERKWNDAVAQFDQVIAQDANDGRAYYFKALALLGKGDRQVAKSVLAKSIELNPKDLRAKLLRADLYLKERDFTGAEKNARQVLEVLPAHYQAHSILGRAYMGQSKLKEAQTVIGRMIAMQPDNAYGFVLQGMLLRVGADNAGALASFEKALALDKGQLDVLAQIVGIYASRNDFETALARCERQMDLVKESPFHQAFILNLKGRLYADQDMGGKAESAYQSAIAAYANFTQPYFGLAQLYLQRRQIDKAIAQYDAMLQKNPNMVGPHMLLGTLYDTQKKFGASEKHYREVLRIDDSFAPAANNLAFLLAEQSDKLDEALMLAQKAKEKLPQDPSVMDTLGWVYYKRGLYDSAIAEFVDSIEKLPNNASVHYHLGLAYYKKEDYESAREHLSQALKLDEAFDGAEMARKILMDL